MIITRYEIMSDLNNLNVTELANKGTVLELLNPFTGDALTDKGEKCGDKKNIKPFSLRLLGYDSDVFRNGINRRAEKNANKKNKKVDLDEALLKTVELLAKCTLDCYMIEKGKVIVFSKDEMIRLYLQYRWLKEQAEDHMADRGVLMPS